MGNVVKMERKCAKCGKRPSECEGYPKGPRTFLCPWQTLKPADPAPQPGTSRN